MQLHECGFLWWPSAKPKATNSLGRGFVEPLLAKKARSAELPTDFDCCTAVCWTYSLIVRLLTRIRRKDGSDHFGGFVYVWDGPPQRDFVLWVFMCLNNITLFFDSIFAATLCLLCVSSTATTPRATKPHLYCKGYHAFTTARLPRLCIYIPAITPQLRVPFPGYHT